MLEPMAKADSVQNLPSGSFRYGPIIATDQLRHHCVLECREFRKKMMELKDKSHVSVTESGQFGGTPLENILVFEAHLTPCRGIQTPQEMEQRAFAGTG